MKKLLALLLAVMMLVSVMAACAPKAPVDEQPDASASDTPAEPEADGEGFELDVCIASEPQTIDPALNSAVDGGIMLSHFFEGLMKWVDDGNGNAKLTNGIAEDYEKTTDDEGNTVYTFKLREDAMWSDGQPVTAEDFVYSWQRLATPETAADYAYMISTVKNYSAIYEGTPTGEKKTNEDGEEVDVMEYADPTTLGVAALDEHTFQVTLPVDAVYFLEVCAFPCTFPVRKDVIEANGDQWTFDPATYISNGPYKMEKWEHNSFIRSVPNEYYYDAESIGPDAITYHLMDNNNAMLTSFQDGTLDFINDTPVDEIPSLIADGSLKIVPQFGTYYCCFNVQKEPFTDPKVREAFSLAIDRNFIVESVTQTGQIPADAFVCPGIADAEGTEGDDFHTVGGGYYSVKPEDYEANCEKAKALLAEAGYPDGEGFPVVEYLYNTNDNHKAIAEALQNMWKTVLGVDVTLNNQEWGVFLQTRKDGNYAIARNGWLPDYNDAMSYLDMWLTGGGNNDAQYSRPEYDEAIKAALATSDPAERFELMHKAEDMIVGEDKALVPLYFYTQKYMLNPEVEGMFYNPLGFFYFMNCSQAAA